MRVGAAIAWLVASPLAGVAACGTSTTPPSLDPSLGTACETATPSDAGICDVVATCRTTARCSVSADCNAGATPACRGAFDCDEGACCAGGCAPCNVDADCCQGYGCYAHLCTDNDTIDVLGLSLPDGALVTPSFIYESTCPGPDGGARDGG